MKNKIHRKARFIIILCTLLAPLSAPAQTPTGASAFRESNLYLSEEPVRRYHTGVTLEEKGLLDEAEKEYREVVQLAPAFMDARRRLADIYLLRGEPERAVEQYRAILGYHGENPVVHLRLGIALEQCKRYPEAIAAYRTAAKLTPGQLPARKRLASILKQRGRVDEAVGTLKEILAINPEESGARDELIAIYIRKKNYKDLTDLLQEEADRDPANPVTHYKLGIIYEYTRNYPEAEKAYRDAVERKGDFAKALNALGRLYMKTGRFDEAKPVLEAARKADPDLKETRLLLQSLHDDLRPKVDVSKKERKKSVTKKRRTKHRKKSVRKSRKKTRKKSSTKRKSHSSKSSKKKPSKKKSTRKK